MYEPLYHTHYPIIVWDSGLQECIKAQWILIVLKYPVMHDTLTWSIPWLATYVVQSCLIESIR